MVDWSLVESSSPSEPTGKKPVWFCDSQAAALRKMPFLPQGEVLCKTVPVARILSALMSLWGGGGGPHFGCRREGPSVEFSTLQEMSLGAGAENLGNALRHTLSTFNAFCQFASLPIFLASSSISET